MMYPGRRKTKLPRTNFMNLKTVEVPRGRNGYGFTVSGQSPCVLSCILHGSPAEIAGLKAGDSVIAVNGENVTRLSHEQIIKLIGATTGVLRLTVAEVDYSESSDEEYVYMPRTRYPHTKRSQSATPLSMMNKPRAEMVVEEIQSGLLLDSFSAMPEDIPQAMLRGAEVQRIQADMHINSSKFAPGHLSPYNKSGKPEIILRKSPHNYDYTYWNGKAFEKVSIPPKIRKPKRHNDQRNRLFSTPTPSSYYVQENPYDDADPDDLRPLSPVELSNLMYPDASHTAPRNLHKSMSYPGNTTPIVHQGQIIGASVLDNEENIHMRAMVGYLGSIDIPASANLPTASLHAIRGCVRRLHKEHRVHSFMMMEIGTDGVRLVNSNQRVAVVYPRERLAFSGVCPDDKRFFGIVTSHNPEETIDAIDSDDEPIGSSCHVFMVDPNFMRHDVHARVTAQFAIICNTDPESNTCDIFPSSAKPILQRVSQLYQDRSDLNFFGELYGQSPFVSGPRRSNSTNSSNSDSGFGNGNSKDQNDFSAHMDHMPILDVAAMMRNQRNGHVTSTPYGASTHVVKAEINTSMSSDVPYSQSSTSPQSDTSPRNVLYRSSKDISGRLTPRVRPDPVGFRSPSVVPNQQKAYPNHQQPVRPSSVQVPLQTQLRASVGTPSQLKPPQQKSESDFRSQKPNTESSGSSTLEDNSQKSKEIMGPPTGLPPSGRHSMYSKQSAVYPDVAIDRSTARKVQEELARRLSENQAFQQTQQLLRRNSDCSEYSSSNRLSKPMIERLQKIRQDSTRLVATEETLASSDGDLNHDDKGIHASASNPNLAAQGGDGDLDPTIGRVSRWAVDFERLLTDELGLCCFTEFLKKEFSEENIMFWIACEKMAKITDRGELQKTAQEIYDKHLAPKALMPVNLDSGARALVEEAIKNPTPEMFKTQQQQIFKLMKFDSYARFLKSKLYQDCVLAEMASLPLPISLEKTDGKPAAAAAGEEGVNAGGSNLVVLGEGSGSGERNGRAMSGPVKERMDRKKSDKKGDKKKPSFSEKDEENGDKKKTSILPWRNKQKKPKDGDKPTSSSGNEETSVSSRHSSVTSSDFRPAGGKYVDMNHCFHMIFPNNEILTLTPEPDQNLGQVLMPLLEERGLGLQNVEIFLNDTKESDTVKQKLVDMDQMATSLIGRQIIVERRVLFKIELPNKRVIGVKSKLSKKIIEVLRPVAYKYKLHLDAMVVHLSDSPVPLDLDFTVASLDGQRILIETLKTYSGSYDIGGRASVGPSTSGTQQGGDEISHTRAASVDSFLRDEDPKTSSVQTEMLKAKLTATMSMQPPGDTRRDQRNLSAATAASPATKVGTLTTAPAPAPPTATPAAEPALTNGRTEGRRKGNLKIMDKDTEDLIAMVSKAQNKRLDDQRGLTLRNLELPDFLKVPSTSLSSTNPIDNRPKSSLGLPYGTQPLESGKNHQHKELTAADIEALKLRPKSTPPRPNAVVNGGAVFSDGILPTHSQAEELFGGSNPRNPVVRFNDTVVSSTYRDTSWDDTSTANYSQKPDMVPLSMTPDSYQLGSYPANKADKLSPRAYGHSPSDGNDSIDHGHNNTAYSLEFNSSYGSGDQPSLNATLTSSPSESKLQLPPVPDLDSTLQETMANYTPPPSLNNKQESPSRDIGPTRQTPIIHPFSAGSTLPGHTPDLLSKPILDSGSYASNGYSRSISAAQLSCSNNNNTFLPSSKSVPDIQTETNNCYSNYCPIPTTPDGSFYGSSPTVEAPPKAQPDVSQMYSRALRPPPSYHSSRGAGIGRTISAPSMNSMSALPSGTQPAGRQGSQHGEFWSRVTSSGTDAQTTPGLHGSCKQIPYKKVGGHPTWSHPSAGGARPRVSSSGTIGGASGACSGSSTGAQGYTMPASGGAYQKSVASGDTNFQGKETVIISKDGRKLRATFV